MGYIHQYTKISLIPIQLFNFHDNVDYVSFAQIEEEQSPHINDIENYIQNCFEKYENQHLLIQLLLLFPFIVFSDVPKLDFNSRLESIESLSDKEKFKTILNFRINRRLINETLNKIEEVDGASIERKDFFSSLFMLVYKYCYIQLTESIYLKNETKSGKTIKLKMTFKEFINQLDKTENELEIANSSYQQYDIHEEYEKFINSFGFNLKYRMQIIKEIKMFSTNSKLAKVLYNTIDENIDLPPTLASKEKNKFLRPLFKEIVCKICYPIVFTPSYSQDELNRKYRKFLTTYKKI